MGHGVGARVFVPSLCVYLLANSQSGRKAKCAGADDYFLINRLLFLFDYELP